MINVRLLILFVILGAGLGVCYNFLVVRNYPEYRRKGAYVGTVIVFIIVTAALFSLYSVRSFTISTVNQKAQMLEQGIMENYPDVGVVKNGIDITKIKNDKDNAIADLLAVIPSNTELGIDKTIYNFVSGLAKKELDRKLRVVDNIGNKAGTYTDENNILTVSSLINGIKRDIMKIVNIVILIFASIFVIILFAYIISSLSFASKGKKSKV